MSKKIAPFQPMSDYMSISVIKEDIKKISDLKGFIGHNKNNHVRHNGSIYAGTENLVAHVGDGKIIEENLTKELLIPNRGQKKKKFTVVAFNMGNLKEMTEKFPQEEYKWELLGDVQMTVKRITIKQPAPVVYRPKARPFKESGVMGDLSTVDKIDGQHYSFCPEMQVDGLKIIVTKR